MIIKKLYIKLWVAVLCLSISFSGCAGTVRFTSKEKINDKTEEKVQTEAVLEEDEKSHPIINSSEILETKTGVASYYGKKFHGRKTANGETYNMNDLTAAHKDYPFNSLIKVTNLLNNKSVVVRINDRKPDFHGRIIDLSYAAAKELDMLTQGIAEVKVEVVSWGTK